MDNIIISKKQDIENNPYYLGYDENHDGDFDDYYMCANCKENNYLTLTDSTCILCSVSIEWV